MKRIVLAVLLSGVVFGATAQTPVAGPATLASEPTAVSTEVSTEASSETPVAKNDDSEASTAKLSDKRCIRYTGSRINNRNQSGKCNGQPGNSYDREDLLRTGQSGIGEALRTLDTSIR